KSGSRHVLSARNLRKSAACWKREELFSRLRFRHRWFPASWRYVKLNGERKLRFARGLTRAARRAIAAKAQALHPERKVTSQNGCRRIIPRRRSGIARLRTKVTRTSQQSLGTMYEYGKGVPQDYFSAYMWLSLSTASQPAVASEF